MKKNILLFLKTPKIQFRKKAIAFLKKKQLTLLAQYGNIAFEMSLTDEELKFVSGSDFFVKIYEGIIASADMEKLSGEAREIAASWNLDRDAQLGVKKEVNSKKGLSWGTEGLDEPRPFSELSEDFFLKTLQKNKIPQVKSPGLKVVQFNQKKAIDSFSKIEKRLLKIVKDETKVYHLVRLAIVHPELEETIFNLPQNVIDDLFKKKKNVRLGVLKAAAAAEESCWKMNGEISVGVVFVESSRNGGPIFSSTERTTLRNEIQTGLNWLASENETGNLSWVYDYHNVSIDVANGTDTSSEDYWRNPAMQAVAYNGHTFSGNWTGVANYREDMRVTNESAHAIVIFVTPFATSWHAY